MRSLFRSLAAAGLAALVVPAVAVGQRPIELGLDGGVGFKVNDPTATFARLPVQSFRVGFHVSDLVSFEPSMSLNWTKQESSDAETQLALGASVLYHFAPARGESQGYIRPLVQLLYDDPGPGTSETQFALGGGIGIKLRSGTRFAIRLEGSYTHAFESGALLEQDVIAFTVGFSYFTR